MDMQHRLWIIFDAAVDLVPLGVSVFFVVVVTVALKNRAKYLVQRFGLLGRETNYEF